MRALCILSILATILMTTACQPAQLSDEDIEAQIEETLQELTPEEKVRMIHASSSFTSGGVERLGIPELVMSDGPHGVRHEHGRDWTPDEDANDANTYLPVGTALAATWNPDLGYAFGQVLGREAAYRGKDIILGPGFNIIRDPLNGRNFEYMTEDPYLNAQMAVQSIKGIQEQGIAACAKHYIANSLEYERDMVDVQMSERALREIYLPAFKAAVQEAGVHTIMSAYNKLRGEYCSHSAYLLDEILRGEYGYKGLVVSDWNAVKSTMGAIDVGLDIEMGTDLQHMREGREPDYNDYHLGDTLLTLLNEGKVEEVHVDNKVRNILRVMHKIHKFDGQRPEGAFNTPQHQQVARKVADEALVLLKNDGVLPMQQSGLSKLAVVGAHTVAKHSEGGGSSQVKALYEVTPMEGLQNLLGESTEILFAEGFEVARDTEATDEQIAEAVDKVKEADAAIYFGGWTHGYSKDWGDAAFDWESADKSSLELPFGQNKLINAVLDANPNTVIVLFGGGPMDMEQWGDKAKGILQVWYPGMDGGNAIADVLFGKVNPSGKLPMTYPKKLEDSPAHALASYPDENLIIDHKEDIFVGYRYFDSYDVEPAFAFGHGLSYTDFRFANPLIKNLQETVTITMTLLNTGEMAGAEVVQVYVEDVESRLRRPQKELKAFKKVFLDAGESKQFQIELDRDAFRYFDDEQMEWVLEPGTFKLHIGASSRDIRLTEEVEMF